MFGNGHLEAGVAFADRGRSICDLSTHYLERQHSLKLLWTATREEEVERLLHGTPPALLIIDPAICEGDPVEMITRFRRIVPALHVLVFSFFFPESFTREFLRSRRFSVVSKESALEVLMTAILVIDAGGFFIDPCLRSYLERNESDPDELCPREREVLRLVAEGYSSKEIANRLSVAVKTADKYRERIMTKLNLHDAVKLTRYAIRIGLAPLTFQRAPGEVEPDV